MMNSMFAYCGLTCDNCPIYLATWEPDKERQQAMRVSIAQICREIYGMNLQPSDINDCDGCRAISGRLFFGCSNCAIRQCASEKAIESCAFCEKYPCPKLQKTLIQEPEAQTRLNELRNKKP
ncbi:MAG: DUF3795 domain-containing protein [Bacteroidota bacterium]|nr:DUF3795 domain-containing protein [Bacteroidota bacterium]